MFWFNFQFTCTRQTMNFTLRGESKSVLSAIEYITRQKPFTFTPHIVTDHSHASTNIPVSINTFIPHAEHASLKTKQPLIEHLPFVYNPLMFNENNSN